MPAVTDPNYQLVLGNDVQRLRALLSPTFVTETDEVLYRLGISIGFYKLAEISAQFYASWIKWRSLWVDAYDELWRDPKTGVVYASQETAPEGSVLAARKRRWQNFTEFVEWVNANLPVSATTFWLRNQQIELEIRMWIKEHKEIEVPLDVFLGIVEGVCTSRSIGRIVASELLKIEKSHNNALPQIAGINYEQVERVAPIVGVKLPNKSNQQYEQKAMEVARKYIDQQRERIDSGEAPRVVLRDLRRTLKTGGTVEAHQVDGDLVLELFQQRDEDTPDFDTELPKRYVVKFVGTDGEMVKYSELPHFAREHLSNRLKFAL